MQPGMTIEVHRKPRPALSRADYQVTGDINSELENATFFVHVEVDHRNLDRHHSHLLTIGFIETVENMEVLNAMANGAHAPENLTIATTNGKVVISKRSFADLKFRSSSIGWATMAGREMPVQKLIYEAILSETWFADPKHV